jgi:hypothetical protein
MLADFQVVLDRLGVASRNGEKALSFCPAHNDRNTPSLSLKAENGRLLLHCFAGCHPEDIVSKVGLQMKDLFSERGGGIFIPPNTPARLHAQDGKSHTNAHNRRASGDARLAVRGLLAGSRFKGRNLLGEAGRPHPVSR